MEDQGCVVPSLVARVNATDTAVRSPKAEVQTWGATTICVIACREKDGFRFRDPWTNDVRALLVSCHVFPPWELTVKIDWFTCCPLADVIEGVSGSLVE